MLVVYTLNLLGDLCRSVSCCQTLIVVLDGQMGLTARRGSCVALSYTRSWARGIASLTQHPYHHFILIMFTCTTITISSSLLYICVILNNIIKLNNNDLI